jgi:hypothetical protein
VATTQQEDQGQADQQDIQRHFVGRLLPARAFDQGNHAVEGGLAGVGADSHQQPVRHQAGVAGHRRAVAAGLTDHRRGFAGNRRFIDGRDTFDYLAVARDQLTGLDPHHIALAQAAGRYGLELRTDLLARHQPLAAGLEAVGAGLATALGQCFGEVGEEHGEPQPQGDLHAQGGAYCWVGDEAQHAGDQRRQLHHQHHWRAHQLARVELDEGLLEGRAPQRAEAGLRLAAGRFGAALRRYGGIHHGFSFRTPGVRPAGPGPAPA